MMFCDIDMLAEYRDLVFGGIELAFQVFLRTQVIVGFLSSVVMETVIRFTAYKAARS